MNQISLLMTRLTRILILSFLVVIAVFYPISTVSRLLAQSIETLCSNPDFETGKLNCWDEDGTPGFIRVVQTQTVFAGNYAALIGDPFTTRERCAGNLPLGSTQISYVIVVPVHGEPTFSFNYRVFSYDEIIQGKEDKFDKFDVYIDDLYDSQAPFRVFRTGSNDGLPPSGSPRPCDFQVDASDWLTASWKLNSVQNFDNPDQVYDLRGRTINVIFKVFSQEEKGNSGWYNTWIFIDNLQLHPEMTLSKSSDPPGPVHEGDVITYTLSYANTSLTTQTMTLTDVLPFNVNLIPDSVPPTVPHGSTLVWNLGNIPPGESGQVSFQVQVPLFLSSQTSLNALCEPEPTPPPPSAYILPATIACDTTRFWANGVTAQPSPPGPYTLQVQLPPGAHPSEMWLLMKGMDHTPPTVGGQAARQVITSTKSFSASLWSASITPTGIAGDQVTVITHNPRELNALFLLDKEDPPFDKRTLQDFYNTVGDKQPKTFTYTLDLPSVATQTIEVMMPFMDITYLTDDTPLQPDMRVTTVTMAFAGQQRQVMVNNPNLGNGLLMTQFLFDIGPLAGEVATTETLTVTVDTQDSIYTLAPRVCRPVYIENTAWLCSDKAGCTSATAQNIPEHFRPPSIYLPIIMKSSP